MAVNPISSPLPADLPTNWQTGQTVAPNGSDVGLAQQYGYNYQSQQINAAQQAANALGEAFPNLYGKDDTVPIANGGTGGTSVAAALANLGAQPGFNLLVNSRFKYNGRNQTSYTGGALTVDGWNSAPGSVTITLPDGVAVANAASISQLVQQDSALFSKSATFSVEDSTGTVYSVSATMPESAQNTSSQIASQSTPWGSIAIWNSNTGSAFSAIISATSAVTLTAAKLEVGSVSTLAADLATAQDETIEQLRLDMYDLDPGRPAWVLTQNENLLDNWYFVGGGSQQGGGQFPINQRGQTSYTSAGYGIDRWKIIGTSGTVNISLNNNYLAYTDQVNTTLNEYIENPNKLSGKTVTLSIVYKSNIAGLILGIWPGTNSSGNIGVINTTIPQSNEWNLCAVSGTITNSSFLDYLRAVIQHANTSGEIDILAVKLELGTRSTLARLVNGQWVLNDPPPNFQQELAKCQRYLYRISPMSGSSVCQIGNGWANSSVNTNIYIYTPPMRNGVASTLIQSGTFYIGTPRAEGSKAIPVTSITLNTQSDTTIQAKCAVSEGLTVGYGTELQIRDNNTVFMLSREL